MSSSFRNDQLNYRPSDLENYGVAGPNKVRELLTNCVDPLEAIRTFQTNNCIQLPTLNPAMKLLDLHGVRRSEYHELVLNDVSERLMSRLRALGESRTKEALAKLEAQLDKSFQLYRVPQIRPIVLETLKQMPRVPDRYLKVIVGDTAFYKSCAVTVRQQIWMKNEKLFEEAVQAPLDSYIAGKERLLRNVECGPSANFFVSETTKARRQWPQIQELISIVGYRESLYDRLLQLIRQRFAATGNVHYCSLRLELIMAAHDLNVEPLIKLDACHDFAWCVDACVRDKHVDGQQTQRLRTLLDNAKQTVADLAMIAGDVHVVHFLTSLAVKVVRDSVLNGSGHLSRDLQSLHLLFRLIALGTSAHSLVTGGLAESPLDSIIFTKFFPALTTMLTEDVIRTELARAPDDVSDEFSPHDFLSPTPEAVQDFVKTDGSCAIILIHFLLEMLPSKKRGGDMLGLNRYLTLLPKLKDKCGYRDVWLHILLSRLMQSNVSEMIICSQEFIEGFLMKGLQVHIGVKYHCLRVIHFYHSILGENVTRQLLGRLSPEILCSSSDNENKVDMEQYTTAFARLVDKTKLEHKPSCASTTENLILTSP